MLSLVRLREGTQEYRQNIMKCLNKTLNLDSEGRVFKHLFPRIETHHGDGQLANVGPLVSVILSCTIATSWAPADRTCSTSVREITLIVGSV